MRVSADFTPKACYVDRFSSLVGADIWRSKTIEF